MNTRNHVATNGRTQIHFFSGGIDDDTDHWDNLDFDTIISFSHGHHARGGGGNDTFNFANLDNVSSVIVGRLEDFDPSRDEIRIDGTLLDFNDLPENVRVVEFNGNHNDPGAYTQQWLLIDTPAGGNIFYALEGARVDMDGNGAAKSGLQEGHFIQSTELPDFSVLSDVAFIDPQNFVPDGFEPQGGVTINDVDVDAADVIETVSGTKEGDLIAAGINDDVVKGRAGHDLIWGGSGAR